MQRGVEIHHDGDLPARSGMGSSSAFTVGLLHAVHGLKGEMVSKDQLARESVHLEQEVLQETVGSQDQISTAYGGFNHISFQPTGEYTVRPVTVRPERLRELNAHLMLFYTGIKRTASNVADSYVNGIEQHKRQLRVMKDLVEEGLGILGGNQDLCGFGELLHEAWQSKRSMSDMVSNSEVDDLYARARFAGALGGKLTGAGGGGFLLLFVEPDNQETVRSELEQLIHVPFEFEQSGSQIIFYDPQPDYTQAERWRATQSICAFRELASVVPASSATRPIAAD
jgi:D-glycero-alpha-D-manno-heptose-7-phosphate kinase